MRLPRLPHSDWLLPRTAHTYTEGVVEHGTAVVRKVTRTLAARSSSTCSPGDNSQFCEKPTSTTNSQTLPIVLGVVIPLSCAIVVFIYLHRRNKKRQAIEDANDPHKSLDFGMITAPQTAGKKKRGKRGAPEMIDTNLPDHPLGPGGRPRGLSMDMLGSPYILPAALRGSRESLRSMSRSVQDEHDPYRHVTLMRTSTDTARSPRPFNEHASVYSASTTMTGPQERSNLLANAQRMSQSFPARGDSIARIDSHESEDNTRQIRGGNTMTLPPLHSHPELQIEDAPFPFPPEPAVEKDNPPRTSPVSVSRPPRKDSAPNGALNVESFNFERPVSDSSFYGDEIPPPPAPPKIMTSDFVEYEYAYGQEYEHEHDSDMGYAGRFSIDTPAPSQQYPVQENRLSFMGLRPLPPDHPEENPEQRANRIRSFYKEYFDVNRPHPANAHYEEDWDMDYYGNGAGYHPNSGEYYYPQAPYAQPMGRRAMTPPPRGAGGPRLAGQHDRHYSAVSAGGAPFRGRPTQPRKKLPPPKTLTSLPTPHLLKDDAALIMNPIDFAPPTTFREQQNGRRADSPLGIQRPYSPSVKAHSPLVSAFDGLNALPSPHLLRKSGTFTSLDFSPTPRFRGQEGTGSDAGSIRSARSGISAMQVDAVRAGAYRVSRIPKGMVTTRDDTRNQLRPQMNLINPA